MKANKDSDRLDEQLRGHYAAASLDDDALGKIRAAVREEAERAAEPEGRSRWRWAFKYLAAAAVLAVVALGPYLGWWGPGRTTARRLAQRVATEIALNHTKQLPSDLLEKDLVWATLAAATSKQLDFSPVQPAAFKAHPHRLLGARYASVDGQIALQIRMTDERQDLTLYQFRPGERFAKLHKKYTFEVHGVRILIWQEQGLVMGLARFSADLQ